MVRILISASFPERALVRQSPRDSGTWGEFQFLFARDGRAVDGWTVYDNLRETIQQACPKSNTLLITGEPISVRKYRSRFTSQFAHVWTSHAPIQHRSKIQQHEAQPWHYGLYTSQAHSKSLGFDDLVAMPRPQKPKLLSVLCSNKTMTADHRQRRVFVQQLREAFGGQIDIFGRGIRECADKADAIYPYKYHIVLENDHSDFFMTEKLPDAFLGWSFPIYAGGPAASHLFPSGSFAAVDMHQPDQAIARIRLAIARHEYESKLSLIQQARELVLWKYNLFAMQADFWREHLQPGLPTTVTLFPKQRRIRLLVGRIRGLFVRHEAQPSKRTFGHRGMAIPMGAAKSRQTVQDTTVHWKRAV